MYLNLPETFREMGELIKERDSLNKAIVKARGGPAFLSGAAIDGMPKGTAQHPDAMAAIDELDAMTAKLNKIKAKLGFLAGEIGPLLEMMPEGIKRRMLAARYVDCMSMILVARTLPYNRSQLYRAMEDAEKELIHLTNQRHNTT